MKLFSLTSKIIMSLLIVGGFFFAVILTLESILTSFEQREIEHHTLQTNLFLSSSVRPMLASEDYDGIQNLVESLALKDETVLSVSVFNSQQQLVAEHLSPLMDASAISLDASNRNVQFYSYPNAIKLRTNLMFTKYFYTLGSECHF